MVTRIQLLFSIASLGTDVLHEGIVCHQGAELCLEESLKLNRAILWAAERCALWSLRNGGPLLASTNNQELTAECRIIIKRIILHVASECDFFGTVGFVRAMQLFDNLIIAVATFVGSIDRSVFGVLDCNQGLSRMAG